jgi:autophagy-related protein 18
MFRKYLACREETDKFGECSKICHCLFRIRRVSFGTRNGFHIFTCEPFKQMAQMNEGTRIVEVFFNSMLVAQVGDGDSATSSQRTLRMINTKREKEIIRMNYDTKILSVKLNRLRLVVVLEEHIYIYDVRNMKLTHTIANTPKNTRGVSA